MIITVWFLANYVGCILRFLKGCIHPTDSICSYPLRESLSSIPKPVKEVGLNKVKPCFGTHFKPPIMKSSTGSKKLQRLLMWSPPIFSMTAIVAYVESKKQKKRDTADETVSERYIIKAKGFTQLGKSDATLFYFERALETGFDYCQIALNI